MKSLHEVSVRVDREIAADTRVAEHIAAYAAGKSVDPEDIELLLEDLSDEKLDEVEDLIPAECEEAWNIEKLGRLHARVYELRDEEREADNAEQYAYSEYCHELDRDLENAVEEGQITRDEAAALRDELAADDLDDEAVAALRAKIDEDGVRSILRVRAAWREVGSVWGGVSKKLDNAVEEYNALAGICGRRLIER